MLSSAYPYTSGTGDDSTDCLYSDSEATNVTVKKIEPIHWGNSNMLKAAVQQQPVPVAITANNVYIHSYASGIIDAIEC